MGLYGGHDLMSRLENNPSHPLFLPAAIRALRLHRRLVSLFVSESRLFEGLALATGKLHVSEQGERHELWKALEGLEFLLLGPDFGGPALSSQKAHTILENKRDAVLMRTPSGSLMANQLSILLQGEKAQGSEESLDSAPWLSMIPIAPAHDPRSMPADAAWPGRIQERYAPVKWANLHRVRGDQHGSETDKRETATFSLWPSLKVSGVRSFGIPRSGASMFGRGFHEKTSAFYDGIPRLHKQIRNSGKAEGVVASKDRPAPMSAGFSPVSFPTAGPGSLSAEEIERRPMADFGDAGDAPWRFLVSQSQGAPLGIFQRVRLKPFFPDMDLGDVRIHTDEPADHAAQALQADAFSLGRNIYFRTRKFNPFTSKGLALLGHELVHTRQMINAAPFRTAAQREGLEREAERTEVSLMHALYLPDGLREKQQEFPSGKIGNHYLPLSLEPARPVPFLPDGKSGLWGGAERATSLSALPSGEQGVPPMKAEEGRAAVSGAGGAGSPSAASDDQEGMTRTIFRVLERKIRAEKERRGVDRWAH